MTVPQQTPEQFKAALLDAALGYIKLGLPSFPIYGPAKIGACSCPKGRDCDDCGKHPLAKLVPHGLLGATTDELTIRRWWKSEPRANIGIALPSGYAVLDIDGLEGLEAIHNEGWTIPETVQAQTSRGWHHWFRTTTDIRPGSDFMDHVDMRGPGGYVVAPPSMHRSTTLYEWEAGHALGEFEIAAAPDWLYELAQRPSRSHAKALNDAGIDMAEMLRGVNEGSRDWDIFRVASKLRRSDVPYDLALEICTRMAASCNPPETEEKAQQKVDSAYGRYQPAEQLDSGYGQVTLLSRDAIQVALNSPNGPVEFTFREMQKTSFDVLETEMTVRLMQPGTPMDTYQSRVNLLSHSSREGVRRELQHVINVENKSLTVLFNRAKQEAMERFLNQPRAVRVSDIAAPSRVEYLVDQFLIDSERPTILFGPGGSLKTFVMYSVMLSLAAGRDWMGRKVQKRNCLLIDYETGQGMAGYRLRMLARGLGLEAGLSNIHWWDPDGVPLYDLTEPVKRDIEALNIGFIGLDHCAAACGVEPERSESATRIQRAAARWKVPAMFLAHVTGNISDNPEYAKRPFGSIFWENMASLTWFIRKEEQAEDSPVATVGLFQRKWNDTGRLRDFSLTFDFDSDRIELQQADLRDSATLRQVQGLKWVVWDALDNAAMTVEDIGKLTNMGPAKVRAVVSRYKAMFVAEGDAGPKVWRRSADFVVSEQDRNTEAQQGRNSQNGVAPLVRAGAHAPEAPARTHAPSGGEAMLRPGLRPEEGVAQHPMSLRDGVAAPLAEVKTKYEPDVALDFEQIEFDVPTETDPWIADDEPPDLPPGNGHVVDAEFVKPGEELPW